MKLVTAVVHSEDAGALVDALLEKEYRATRLNSSGGFLKQGNATILIGCEDDQVKAVLSLISANCHARKQFVNPMRSEAHTSELQSLMRISYAVYCLKTKNTIT